MNIIELFAGAAGLAQGFMRSGYYDVVALYDIFKPAQQSFLAYDNKANYLIRDVCQLTDADVQIQLDSRTLHGIIGGPPCQGFSLAGKRIKESKLNELVMAYGKAVETHKPYFLVMENVPQLLYHPLFAPLLSLLEREYCVSYGILNAARYGAPQTRHRLFVIAYHRSIGVKPTFPKPTHGQLGQLLYSYHLQDSRLRIPFNDENAEVILGADPVIGWEVMQQVSVVDNSIDYQLKPLVTVGDAISDVGNVDDSGTGLVEYSSSPTTEYQKHLRNGQYMVANCVARKHTGPLLQLAQTLREGGTPQSDGGSRNKQYYSQAYGRLHRAALARTLTTFFQNAGSGRFLHYERPRTISIREAARLQGFPDNFVFQGSLQDQMQLIGNAVPLPLAEAIGRHVANQISQILPD